MRSKLFVAFIMKFFNMPGNFKAIYFANTFNRIYSRNNKAFEHLHHSKQHWKVIA